MSTTTSAPDLKPRQWTVEHWTTVAVVGLPMGWRNVYRDGEREEPWVWPCPALLLQELRETTHGRDVPTGSSTGAPFRPEFTTEHHQPPYETQTVFAERDDFGGLCAACKASNYVTTIGPGEDHPAIDTKEES